jgi:hypothetical protein
MSHRLDLIPDKLLQWVYENMQRIMAWAKTLLDDGVI